MSQTDYLLKRERYERKFVLSTLIRAEVEQIILTHPAAFREIHYKRSVNNIYLDTLNLTYYFDNVVGRSDRRKVRVRWYGDMFGDINNPILEFKIKNGQVGHKLSYPLIPLHIDSDFSTDYLRDIFNKSDLPEWIKDEVKYLEPSLFNSYTRRYFESFFRDYRITVDDHMIYQDIQRRNNTFLRSVTDDSHVILELKYNFSADNNAQTITSHLPFHLMKSSKYVNGIEQFHHVPI
jgi:hypothetical protein